MTWGTEIEFTFDETGGILDSFDISTNFKNPVGGNVFFNIPVALTATAGGAPLGTCNNAKGTIQWPVECLQAHCTTAYQDPRDKAGNGAQLQCPAGSSSATSYTVEFCPGGLGPLQGLSDAATPQQLGVTGRSFLGGSLGWLWLPSAAAMGLLLRRRRAW